MTATPSGRRILAAAFLSAFALWAAAGYEWRKLPQFLAGSLFSGGPSADEARGKGTGFWFDRDYPAFLEAVRRATPANATIAVAVPKTPDVYLYQAVFTLAPRRVIVLEDGVSAGYAAYYKDAVIGQPHGTRIPFGVIERR